MADSLFSFNSCDVGNNNKVLTSDFCLNESLVAVGTDNKTVWIFFVDEDSSNRKISIKGKGNPLSLVWHPFSTNVVIGWEGGSLECYFIGIGETYTHHLLWSNHNIHQHDFVILQWDFSGNYFMSGDINGVCCLWKTEDESVFSIAKHKCKKEITTTTFNTIGVLNKLKSTSIMVK